MRDWLITNDKDRELLDEVRRSIGGFRPWRGSYSRAQRLCNRGLLKKAGISAMPPHVLYVISDEGLEELKISGLNSPADRNPEGE